MNLCLWEPLQEHVSSRSNQQVWGLFRTEQWSFDHVQLSIKNSVVYHPLVDDLDPAKLRASWKLILRMANGFESAGTSSCLCAWDSRLPVRWSQPHSGDRTASLPDERMKTTVDRRGQSPHPCRKEIHKNSHSSIEIEVHHKLFMVKLGVVRSILGY